MAKKKIEVKEIETSKKVKFNRTFNGSLNSYQVEIKKEDLGKVKELPIHIYNWIKKFKVCIDA